MRLIKDMCLTNRLIVFIRIIYDEFSVLMLVHLFAFAANGNPQSGIEWQKAKKTWKSTHTRADSWASYLQRHLEPYIGEHLTLYNRLGV